MADIISLGAARTEASHDSKDWTPVEALRDTIRAIEAGEINAKNCIILIRDEIDEKTGQWQNNAIMAKVTHEEVILQLEVAKLDFLREMGHGQ